MGAIIILMVLVMISAKLDKIEKEEIKKDSISGDYSELCNDICENCHCGCDED